MENKAHDCSVLIKSIEVCIICYYFYDIIKNWKTYKNIKVIHIAEGTYFKLSINHLVTHTLNGLWRAYAVRVTSFQRPGVWNQW